MNEEEIMKVVYNYINNDEIKNISVFTVSNLVDLYKKEKCKNKELDHENQALYESINCNDANMLARMYENLKKDYHKTGTELTTLQIYRMDIKRRIKDKMNHLREDLEEADLGGFADRVRDIEDELLED